MKVIGLSSTLVTVLSAVSNIPVFDTLGAREPIWLGVWGLALILFSGALRARYARSRRAYGTLGTRPATTLDAVPSIVRTAQG